MLETLYYNHIGFFFLDLHFSISYLRSFIGFAES